MGDIRLQMGCYSVSQPITPNNGVWAPWAIWRAKKQGCGSGPSLLVQTVVGDVSEPSYTVNTPMLMLTTELVLEIQMEAQMVLMRVLQMAEGILDPFPSLIDGPLSKSSQNMSTINCVCPLPLTVLVVKT